MNDDGVSSPPPDDFAEAPQVSMAETAAGTVTSTVPTRQPMRRRRPPTRKPAKKKPAKGPKKKRPAARRPAAAKRSGKKKSAKGGRKKK